MCNSPPRPRARGCPWPLQPAARHPGDEGPLIWSSYLIHHSQCHVLSQAICYQLHKEGSWGGGWQAGHPESRAKPETCAPALAWRAAPETGLFCGGLWGTHRCSKELWTQGGWLRWAFRGTGHGDSSGDRQGQTALRASMLNTCAHPLEKLRKGPCTQVGRGVDIRGAVQLTRPRGRHCVWQRRS